MPMRFESMFPTGTPPSGKKQPLTAATASDGVPEITLYGDIVKRRPTNWRTGKPAEGSFIILSEFLDELKKVEKAKALRIRIHSAGGHAYDSMTIHNRLKELAGRGMKIEVSVDGVAMSGGSLIMCAAGTVKVFPGSLVMIHRCWAFLFGGYNASELRREADGNDAVDRSQAAIYHAKTGMSQEDIISMMDAETYMTGQEAIDKGFADEMVEGAALEVSASADRRTLYVGGMPVWVSRAEGGIPQHVDIPVFTEACPPDGCAADGINIKQPGQAGGKEEYPMAKNMEELRVENPELAEKLMAEAQAAASAELDSKAGDAGRAERDRIRGIDEISALFDDETVREAKYGEKPCTAQEMTYRAALKAAKDGKSFMSDLAEDAEASGAAKVGAAPPPDDEKRKADKEDAAAEGSKAGRQYAQMMGGKDKDE